MHRLMRFGGCNSERCALRPHLRGLSTGDFRKALPVLLGDDAAGLSPTNIARLTAVWEGEYAAFGRRPLADRDYVLDRFLMRYFLLHNRRSSAVSLIAALLVF
jgi:hypothetical protein